MKSIKYCFQIQAYVLSEPQIKSLDVHELLLCYFSDVPTNQNDLFDIPETIVFGIVESSDYIHVWSEKNPHLKWGPGAWVTVYSDNTIEGTEKPPTHIETEFDFKYHQLVDKTLEYGTTRGDRTGVGVVSGFGTQLEVDLRNGFPLLTSKFVSLKSVAAELRWFLSGSCNNEDLRAMGCTIWDEWALPEDVITERPLENHERFSRYLEDNPEINPTVARIKLNGMSLEEGHTYLDQQGVPRTEKRIVANKGSLGPVYGKMWRSWPTTKGVAIDQITTLIENLKTNPYSRRHIVSGWNPEFLPEEKATHEQNILANRQVLPPCHLLFQFYVSDCPETGVKFLDLQLYQRSADIALGVPYNVASYALLLKLVAQLCNYEARRFVHTFGDYHIYKGHEETLKTQVNGVLAHINFTDNHAANPLHVIPEVEIDPAIKTLDDFLNWPDDKPWYTLKNYRYAGKFKYDVAV